MADGQEESEQDEGASFGGSKVKKTSDVHHDAARNERNELKKNHSDEQKGTTSSGDEEEDDEEDDDDDDEPHLKYMRVTSKLGSVYRKGDATSAFITSGDKMVCSSSHHRYTGL